MMTWRRILLAEGSGLAVAILIGTTALAVIAPDFLTVSNLYAVLRNSSVLVVVALSQLVALSIGQMNLSLGAIGGLVAVALGCSVDLFDVSIIFALPISLGVGTLAGLFNGVIVARTGINALIITLATGSIFAGIDFGVTRSIPFYKIPAVLLVLGDQGIGALPYLFIAPAITALALAVFFSRFPYGRWMLVFGSNPTAAELSGISGRQVTIIAHTLSGLLAAVAAVLAVAQLGSAQPTIGADWLLPSFAAPIIGGASLAGGRISVVGATVAVLLMGLIESGMVTAKVDPYWVRFLLGALVLAVLGLNHWVAAGSRKILL